MRPEPKISGAILGGKPKSQKKEQDGGKIPDEECIVEKAFESKYLACEVEKEEWR